MVSLLRPVATKNKNKTRLAVAVLGPSPQPAAVLTEIYPTYVDRPRWQVLFQTTHLRERCSHMFGLFCAV
jgi:hypothetical protein